MQCRSASCPACYLTSDPPPPAPLQRALTATEASDPAVARLRSLGTALKELIALWFSVGFLQLERITWQSPCAMLEKVGRPPDVDTVPFFVWFWPDFDDYLAVSQSYVFMA